MAASLDGFIARRDGTVDWLETADRFEDGDDLDPKDAEAFLATIDCYVLTSRELPKSRDTVEFYAGDLRALVEGRLKSAFRNIWFVGGGAVSGECLRLGLADEVRYSILPVLIGDGVSFFEGLDRDVQLHLMEVKGYKSGVVALRHEVRK